MSKKASERKSVQELSATLKSMKFMNKAVEAVHQDTQQWSIQMQPLDGFNVSRIYSILAFQPKRQSASRKMFGIEKRKREVELIIPDTGAKDKKRKKMSM